MLQLISGSPHPASANSRLLRAIGEVSGRPFRASDYLADLPVFQPDRNAAPPALVLRWREELRTASGVVISTPAYLHNVPGVLKNALDWLASSGELAARPTLVFTYTPGPPRGDRARQSLLWSLEALDARVVGEGALYQSAGLLTASGDLAPGDDLDLIMAGLELLPPGYSRTTLEM